MPSPLARVGAGCGQDRLKRGAYLSCLDSPWSHFQSCFSRAWSRVSPLWLFLFKGWLLTTHPSREIICSQSMTSCLGFRPNLFIANSLAAVTRTKYSMSKIPGCHLECHRRGRCVFPERSSFGFQQLSFCLSHLQYSIRYWGSALLLREHIFCTSNFMGRCCDSSLPAKPPAEAYWRNIVLPSNGWHCNIGLLIETAFGSGQSENVDFLSLEGKNPEGCLLHKQWS